MSTSPQMTKRESLDLIKKMVEQRGGVTGRPTGTMTPDEDKAGPNPFFADEGSAFDAPPKPDMVRLSSLVPTWDKKIECMDPWVQVFTGLDDVPDVDPMYIPNQKALAETAYSVEYTNQPGWLSGPPSAGKTSLSRHFAAITGRPWHRITFFKDMTIDEVFGSQRAENGTTTYHMAQLPLAMQQEHALIHLDEPTFAPGETQTLLQEALEIGGSLNLANMPADATDRRVHWALDTHATLGDNTKGTGDASGMFQNTEVQNSAWLDRIGMFIEVTWLPVSQEADMLVKRNPAITSKLAIKIVEVAQALRRGFDMGEIQNICSMRVTQAWAQAAANMRDPKQAFLYTYVYRSDDEQDRTACLEIYRNFFG